MMNPISIVENCKSWNVQIFASDGDVKTALFTSRTMFTVGEQEEDETSTIECTPHEVFLAENAGEIRTDSFGNSFVPTLWLRSVRGSRKN